MDFTRAITARSLVVLASCVPFAGPASGQAPVRRDSAGIAIVTNGPTSAAVVLHDLGGPPAVTIGAADGPEAGQLYRVVGAVRMRDGRIVLANAGSSQLRVFDAAGKPLATIGRSGKGPGEFTGLSWVGMREDSLYAWDDRLLRMSVFAADGRFARSFPLDRREPGEYVEPRAVLRDGTILVKLGRAYSSASQASGASRDTVGVARYSSTGDREAVLARLPGDQSFVLHRDGGVSVTDLLFGRGAVIAGHGADVYIASTDDYRIDQLETDGRTIRSIRSTQPATAARDADVRAEREKRTIKPRGAPTPMVEQLRRNQEAMFDAMPVPRTLPAFRKLVAGDDGRLWVEGYPRPADAYVPWAVYDAEGRLTGTVRVPSRITVFATGRDWLLGHWRDELDVEHVGLWKLQP